MSATGATSSGEGFSFLLSGGGTAGSEARRAVIAGDGELPPAVREDVLLLLTELVSNAVRHAGVGPGQSMRVVVRQWPRRVRVEVLDPGTDSAQVRLSPSRDESGGWGLVLVERIAARWGVEPGGSGTCVWFEIDFGNRSTSS
jgi:anti-sigma regulatory factor (Ser/Thr protein kinase)